MFPKVQTACILSVQTKQVRISITRKTNTVSVTERNGNATQHVDYSACLLTTLFCREIYSVARINRLVVVSSILCNLCQLYSRQTYPFSPTHSLNPSISPLSLYLVAS